MKTGVWLLALAAIVSALWLAGTTGPNWAPDIQFKDTSGKTLSINELRGKPMLVTFWATTCSSCIREIPDLIKLYEEFAPDGFGVIAVAMHYDPPSHVIETARQWQFPFPVVLDLKAELANAFGSVEQIPTNFLIAPDGSIARHRLGRLDLQILRPLIRNMLRKESS